MPRKKVDLSYITDGAKRNATFKKRKNGLIKKIDEISILCGIQACAIIYTPDNPQPEVWPSDEREVQSVISKFKGVSELERSKKMFSQESYLREKIAKTQEKVKKQKNENRKIEMTNLMDQYFNDRNIFNNANMNDLNDISHLIDQKLEKITRKINMSQAQEVTPVVENGGETQTQGDQSLVMRDVQGPATDVDAMQNLNWSMDIINGDGGQGMLTLEDVNVQSDWLNYVP